MLFNTFEYLFFFLATLTVFWCITKRSTKIVFLLLASYYFYFSNNHWLLLLIIASTQVDYLVAIKIEESLSERKRKALLFCSVFVNIGMLIYFKYTNFLGETFVKIAEVFGYKMSWTTLNIILPIGISFYTFQSLSYIIDVYRKEIKAERKWHHLAFCVGFFPHLIAGPIVRVKDFLPQVKVMPKLTTEDFEYSLFRIHRGLLKKIILADTIGTYIDPIYNAPHLYGTAQIWAAIFGFGLQIYFDFSGYTDIALGCSRLLGFKLLENFKNPYSATSFAEFWHRWHISLSSWIRDYLYIPLGGSKTKTRFGTYRNLIITMTIAGIWHGASFNFALWGFLFGLTLAIERYFTKKDQHLTKYSTLSKPLKWLIVFISVNLLWILFRAPNFIIVQEILSKLFVSSASLSLFWGDVFIFILVASNLTMQFLDEKINFEKTTIASPILYKILTYTALWVLVLIFNSGATKSFIYFQF